MRNYMMLGNIFIIDPFLAEYSSQYFTNYYLFIYLFIFNNSTRNV